MQREKEEDICVSFNLIMKKGSRNRQVVFVKWAEPTSRDALSTLQEKKDTLC